MTKRASLLSRSPLQALALAEGVVYRGDNGQGIGQEAIGRDVHLPGRVVKNIEVILPRGQALNNLRAVAHLEFDIDIRVLPNERTENSGEEILGGGYYRDS